MLKKQINKFRNILCYFRLKPFDTSTHKGEEDERHRRIAISAVSGGISQIVNYSVMIIMVPLLLNYLGKEQYGLWLAISSMASFAIFSDFGMGNGLVNVLGEAYGLNNRTMAKQAVSSAYLTMAIMSAILLLIGIPIILTINWSSFFKISSTPSKGLIQNALLIYFFILVLKIVASLVTKIRMAFQETYINNLFLALAKLIMLTGCIIGKFYKLNFLYFVLILAGGEIITLLINNVLLFYKSRTWLQPSCKDINKNIVIKLFKTGAFFYVTGIAAVFAIQIDSLVIGHFLGAQAVPTYTIPLKLFMVPTIILSFVLMPIWPAYREALVKNDISWAKKTFFRTIKLTVLTNTIPVLILIRFVPEIIQLWTGQNLNIPFSLLLALFTTTSLSCFTGAIAMILNGANMFLKQRATIAIVGAIINLSLSIFLVTRIGVSGPIWGTAVSQLVTSIPFGVYYVRKIFKQQQI